MRLCFAGSALQLRDGVDRLGAWIAARFGNVA
jgi:hypothetical protein